MPDTTHRTPALLVALLLGIGLAPAAQAQVKAALTRDIDRASAQPVHGACQTYFTDAGNQPAGRCTLYTVPAGKRLVVEVVSYSMYTDPAQSVYDVLFGYNNSNLSDYEFEGMLNVSPVFVSTSSGARHYAGSQPLPVVIDENLPLSASYRIAGSSNDLQTFKFTGYLVDK